MRGESPVSLANLEPQNRLEHGAWTLFRHGVLPDVPAAPALVSALDAEQAKLEALCGGWAAMGTEARTLIAQWRTAAGCRALIEAWAGGRPVLLSPKQGRLPRAVSADWHRFATLERTLLRELREHYIDKRAPSAMDYLKTITAGDAA